LRTYLRVLCAQPLDRLQPICHRGASQDHRVQQLAEEVSLMALYSDAWWGLWAVIQQRHSAIEFDYVGYARRRFAKLDGEQGAVLRRAGRLLQFPAQFPAAEAGQEEARGGGEL
jgi:hypothetical protein